jgi:predicted permease
VDNLLPAVRSLHRTPGFAVAAILTLALGIGLSTAVFTVADAMLIRQLPVRDQGRIVTLWGREKGFDNFPLSVDDAREFARRTRSLSQVAYYPYQGAWPKPVRDGTGVSRLRQALVSGDFFTVLGAHAVLGRTLRATDDVAGAAPVAVLSYGTWQQKFAGDPAVLGRQLVMYDSDLSYTIVGVMPRGMDYPKGSDFWVPIIPSSSPGGLSYLSVDLVGRLAPGATPANARDEMTAFFGRADASPYLRNLRGVVRTLPRVILGDTRPALFVFAAASALLLLIACINVANLLLARGLARTREIAVRSALGAGRVRIIAQLLAENAMLAIAGGVVGLMVAAGAVRMFVAFAPAGVPRLDEVHMNGAALAGAVGIAAIAMLFFGLAPAIMMSRVELQAVLRSGMRHSPGRGSRMATEALVVAQIALAVVVLSAAGLIARSLLKLERVDLALQTSHLLIGQLSIRYDQFDTKDTQLALLERLLPEVRAVPGVRSVSPVVAVPFAGGAGWDGHASTEGQTTEEAAANPMLNMDVVSPDYFATLGIPIIRGRGFTDADREGAPAVVVVSQSAAREYWPGGRALGKQLTMGSASQAATVVGVVPDTRYRDLRDARPSIYFPLRQSFFPFVPMALAIRATGSPTAIVPTLRRVIGAVDPGVTLTYAAPFDFYLEAPLAQPRLNALLLAVFASAAVALAAIGLFGIMATMVRQRTRELGVRLALGATAGDLRDLVMRRGLVIATAGLALGIIGALLANRLLASLLYEVSATDAVTLVAVAGLLLAVAALATFIPARSSTRIDPAIALRVEG